MGKAMRLPSFGPKPMPGHQSVGLLIQAFAASSAASTSLDPCSIRLSTDTSTLPLVSVRFMSGCGFHEPADLPTSMSSFSYALNQLLSNMSAWSIWGSLFGSFEQPLGLD